MAKLTLNPNPTFNAKVFIPVAGDRDGEIVFTFKYRTLKELDSIKLGEGYVTPEDIKLVASGWDLDDEFSDENIALLLDQRPQSGIAILERYFKESRGAREKN